MANGGIVAIVALILVGVNSGILVNTRPGLSFKYNLLYAYYISGQDVNELI